MKASARARKRISEICTFFVKEVWDNLRSLLHQLFIDRTAYSDLPELTSACYDLPSRA